MLVPVSVSVPGPTMARVSGPVQPSTIAPSKEVEVPSRPVANVPGVVALLLIVPAPVTEPTVSVPPLTVMAPLSATVPLMVPVPPSSAPAATVMAPAEAEVVPLTSSVPALTAVVPV